MQKQGKTKRRISAIVFCILYCTAMLLGAAGCGTAKTENGGTGTQAAGAAEGTQETQEESGSVTAMGRYMESTTPLPEGADIIGRTFALLSDGRLAYYDEQSGLNFSEDEGVGWEPAGINEQIKSNIPDDGYISDAAVAPDGSVLLSCLQFEEEGTDVNVSSSVIKIGADGTASEVSGLLDGGDYINKVSAGREAESIALSLRGSIFRVDWEKGALELLITLPEQPEMVTYIGDRMLCLGNSGVSVYDMKQKMALEKDTVLDEFCRENMGARLNINSDSMGGIIFPGEEGVVYAVYNEGLYRHVEGGNAMEELIDGSFSSLGNPMLGLCGMLRLESGEFLLLTTGEELIRFTYDPDEPTMPEKQLKVYSLEDNYSIRQAISIFQKENPDVYINYEFVYGFGYKYGAEGSETAVTVQDALKNLNVELMSGSGPDVILLDDMDASIYAQKGMLADLTDILDELTGEKKVFENITSAYKEENGAFIIPGGFKLPLICGTKEEVEAVKDLKTYADLVEKIRKKRPEGSITGAFSAEQELKQLMVANSGSWLKGKELDTEALTDFLNQAVRIYQADIKGIRKDEQETFGDGKNAWSIGATASLTAGDLVGIITGNADSMLSDMGAVGKVAQENGYVFDLWPGAQGTGFIPVNKLAVSANSAQPELAKSFVKMMLDTEVQKMNSGIGFPVNREAFDIASVVEEGMSIGSSWKVGSGEFRFSCGGPSEAVVARLKELAEKAENSLEGNAFLEEVVVRYGTPALHGTSTVEQAVQEIQQKSAIYLAE